MGFIKKYMNQTRKPEGILGKIMIKGMNMGHTKLAQFGMDNFPDGDFKMIAELGCGGGKNIAALLKKYKDSKVYGVDYSPLSVEKSISYNKKNLSRCEIKQGDVSKLDLQQNAFDLATAFETIYFWPGLDVCFKNVFNILKDKGYFIITNELSGETEADKKYEEIIEGLTVYKASDIEKVLKEVGFKEVKTIFNENNKWFVTIARK